VKRQAMCGACGCETFKITLHGGHPFHDQVDVQCAKCGSVSLLVPEKPRIRIDWGEHAEGVLAPKGGV
jgi:hypothetical protein